MYLTLHADTAGGVVQQNNCLPVVPTGAAAAARAGDPW